ncbi:MAG: hypothetical protein IKS83_05235 [Victivallales bacterium]|nr:hypothetical protein [Victivallales bacterium]
MTTKPVTTYQCGTLTYTLPRLFFVLFWVVIGSAVISVGTQLPGIMLPVQLKELGVSETMKVFLLTTIGQVLNMTVCPYIGVASDWHRGKWGRRIPYIFLSTPPIVLSLVMFGLSGQLGNRLASWTGAAPVTMTVVAIGLAMFLFQFFNMWVNSVIWYIFNDIIPVKFFGAAMAAFKIGLTAGPSLFHYFLFKHVAAHPTILYIGIAGLYLAGVMLFCLFVKEGEYPPLTEEQLAAKQKPLAERLLAKWKGMGTFVKESFCGRIYIYRYLFQITNACVTCAFLFALYQYQELGLTDDMIGKLNGANGIIGSVGILIVSVLAAGVVNQWHPLRVDIYFYFFMATTTPLYLRWIFGTLPPKVFLWMGIANTVCALFINGVDQICNLPAQMFLFPKSRFGSYCSMQALLRSTCFMLVSILCGGLFDLLKAHYATTLGNDQFAFRYVMPWTIPWHLLAPVFGFLLYREWGRNGGLKNYAAPAIWETSGHEQMETLPVKSVSPKWLLRILPVIDAVFGFFTILMPLYAIWHCCWRTGVTQPDGIAFLNHLRSGGEPGLLWHYLVTPTLLVLAADAIWLVLRIRIVRRSRRILSGDEQNQGLLHPAMALVVLLTGAAQVLNALCGNTFAVGKIGYVTNILAGVTVLMLAIVLMILSSMEHGLPQPGEPKNPSPET